MEQNKPIEVGYVYSLGDGLVRYDGVQFTSNPDKESEQTIIAVHEFTIIKEFDSITREVKPWDKYKTGTRHNKLGHVICIYFSHEIFDLLTYEPTLTVLHGKDA